MPCNTLLVTRHCREHEHTCWPAHPKSEVGNEGEKL